MSTERPLRHAREGRLCPRHFQTLGEKGPWGHGVSNHLGFGPVCASSFLAIAMLLQITAIANITSTKK